MHSARKQFAVITEFRSTAIAIVGLVIVYCRARTLPSFAQEPAQQTFPSAEAATHALFRAAQKCQ